MKNVAIWKVTSLLKGIAILAMVLNHAAFFGVTAYRFEYQKPEVVRGPFGDNWQVPMLGWTILQELTRFCVPLFILIAGHFVAKFPLNKTSMGTQVKKLLIPFLFWSTLGTAYLLLFQKTPIHIGTAALTLIAGDNIPGYYYFPLIIQFYLLSPYFVKWVKRTPRTALALSFVIQTAWLGTTYLDLAGQQGLFGRTFAFTGFPEFLFPRFLLFFVFGIWAALNSEKFLSLIRGRIALLTLIACLSALAIILEHGSLLGLIRRPGAELDVWTAFFAMGQWKMSTTVWSFVAILLLFSLGNADKLSLNWLSKVGSRSLIVYILNGPIILVLSALLRVSHSKLHLEIPVYLQGGVFLAFFLITLYLPVLCTHVVGKYLPWAKALIGHS